MKLRYKFEIMEMDGEYMAVPIGEHASELHCMMKMNKTACEVLQLLQKDTDEDGMIEYFLTKYNDDDSEMIKQSIHRIMEGLRKNNIVE